MSVQDVVCAGDSAVLMGSAPINREVLSGAEAVEQAKRIKVLTLSCVGFTLSFAAWLMFGVLGIPIQQEFQITDVSLSWLVAVAILNGSIWRLPFGMLADRWGGKVTLVSLLILSGVSSFLVASSQSYDQLFLYAFLVGIGGNAF